MKMNKRSILILGIALVWLCLFGLGCGNTDDDDDDDDDDKGAQSEAGSYVSKVGMGVCDLSASLSYYTNVLGLTQTSESDDGAIHEVILESQSDKGYPVALMDYSDGSIDCEFKPYKLVFVVPDAQVVYDAAIAAGSPNGEGQSLPPTPFPFGEDEEGQTIYATISMVRDPSGIINELVQASTVTTPYLTGVGIGVSNREASTEFYTNVIGMEFDYNLPLPDYVDEDILISSEEKGMELVIMNYIEKEGQAPFDYTDQPVKLFFTVSDPDKYYNRVSEFDSTLVIPGSPVQAFDLDGYMISFESDQ